MPYCAECGLKVEPDTETGDCPECGSILFEDEANKDEKETP
jgi:DNA-directed RNA polymerase subunit RPC12/RpoP